MEVNLNQLDIPKASAFAMQALEIVRQEEPDLKQLEQAIMHDPLLASSLLHYANSPLYRRATEVTNVPTALRLLGLKSVKSAIVTAAIRSMLPADSQIGQIILDHMITVSALCRLIGQQCCLDNSDDLEFLGLIHDVGMLTLAANYERTYDKVVHEARDSRVAIDHMEQQEFGLTHDRVTARTIEAFRLPRRYGELLNSFHSRDVIVEINDTHKRDTCVLSLAHLLLIELDPLQQHFSETIPETMQELTTMLQLGQDQLNTIRQSAVSLLVGTPT